MPMSTSPANTASTPFAQQGLAVHQVRAHLPLEQLCKVTRQFHAVYPYAKDLLLDPPWFGRPSNPCVEREADAKADSFWGPASLVHGATSSDARRGGAEKNPQSQPHNRPQRLKQL